MNWMRSAIVGVEDGFHPGILIGQSQAVQAGIAGTDSSLRLVLRFGANQIPDIAVEKNFTPICQISTMLI
jgi:hypothetical protein